jgi:hypothetical protein
VRRRHHPGVVDQDVDRAALGFESVAQRGNAFQGGEIQRRDGEAGGGHGGADVVGGRFALGAVADREHHVGTGRGQRLCQTEAQPAVGAGDDGESAGEVGNVESQTVLHQVTGSS